MRSVLRTCALIGAGLLAAGAAPAFAQDPLPEPSPADPSVSTAPPPEAPFDENPFDLAAPESELDTLSRATVDPFPTLEERQVRRPISVTLRALDKITARYVDIVAPIGEPARFGSLEILPRTCDKRPPEEFPETTAFLEVFDRDLARARASGPSVRKASAPGAPERVSIQIAPASAPPTDEVVRHDQASVGQPPIDPDRIFSGWMFASSPALNPLEHAVYDVWVIDCKTEIVESEAPPL